MMNVLNVEHFTRLLIKNCIQSLRSHALFYFTSNINGLTDDGSDPRDGPLVSEKKIPPEQRVLVLGLHLMHIVTAATQR